MALWSAKGTLLRNSSCYGVDAAHPPSRLHGKQPVERAPVAGFLGDGRSRGLASASIHGGVVDIGIELVEYSKAQRKARIGA